MLNSTPEKAPVRAGAAFVSTNWSVVLHAAGDDAPSRLALAELCRTYWYPLYAFVRRTGLAHEDAEDVVQEFFERLVKENVVGYADQNRGRFRTFLIAALKQYLSRRRQREQAAKRRPEQPLILFDARDVERRFLSEPSHDCTAEKLYEHSWALTVLESAMQRLRAEWQRVGKGPRFELMKDHLIDHNDFNGRELATQLGMSEGAARVALHRLKRQFGEFLRQEVGQTLDSTEEIDDELKHLFAALKI